MSFDLSLKDKMFLPHVECDVHLKVEKGTVHVISGENGIGKTSFLRKLADDTHLFKVIHAEQSAPDFFFDRKLGKFRDILLSSAQLDHSLFNEYWNASGLTSKEDRILSHLSGGESQLLKLISTCSANGDLYLLDEPGQYLDPEKKKLADDLIQRLRAKGKTLLIVEHDPKWISGVQSSSELFVEDGILKARMK